jgi:murein L,D-transpeptidase YcbB/YkuD
MRIRRQMPGTYCSAPLAIATADGEVHFFEDIYGHDVQLAKVLEPEQQGVPVMVAAK